MPTTEALFAAHQTRLYRYFCRAVGHQETARDLTQDVFVRVSRTAVPATDDSGLAAWLFRIARNLAVDYRRVQQRRPENPIEDVARPAPQDVNLAVNRALEALPDVDRDVFLMREVAGLGYQEIAAACGLTPDAVRSRIHRARLQLRDMLAAPVAVRQTTPMRRSGAPTGDPS
jgi:RNA polymerase sigma-70 factor (ECF subfamily)